MYVQIGNDKAIEGYRDPSSDDPDLVRYRPLEGQRITSLTYPEGIGLQAAYTTTLAAVGAHMAVDDDGNLAKPRWIESDSEGLQALLLEHFGISPKHNSRPKTWGKDTGADRVGVPGQED